MSEFLLSNLELMGEEFSNGPRIPVWHSHDTAMEIKEMETKKVFGSEGEEIVNFANLKSTTPRWQGDKDGMKALENSSVLFRGEGERREKKRKKGGAEVETRSVHSECPSLQGEESRTESERELSSGVEKRRMREVWIELDTEKEDAGPKNVGKKGQIEMEGEDERCQEINSLPENVAEVFSPAVTILHSSSLPASPRENESFWDVDTEKSPFLGHLGTPPDGYYQDWLIEEHPSKCRCDCAENRNVLKIGVSLLTAALIFPLLVWGGYIFLPYDAPLLDSAPLRLVYTLRCSIFALVPIILGWCVLGLSRQLKNSVKPFCEGEEEAWEINVHQRYVADSVSLFLLYFLQLAVMAAYLSQDLLKLVPLLTIIFAIGRLVYWVSAALGSSVRGFGFGLSFLPTVAMLGANLYFILTFEAGGTIFSQGDSTHQKPPPGSRQRFWG